MKSSLPQSLYEVYGLDVLRSLPMQSGYRNHNYPAQLADGQMVNVIVYKRESDMLRTLANGHRVAEYLHTKNFPARHLYDARILQLRPGANAQYAALYEYLPGETIPWEAYTKHHIKAMGGAMSNMHALLAGQDQGNLPLAVQTLRKLCERMRAYFADEGVRVAAKHKLGGWPAEEKWGVFWAALAALSRAPAQPLHLDFVRGNVLFDTGRATVSGVLDFEKVAYGHPVVDVARTLAFLLVDCKYKTEAKVRKYFLQSGYAKRGKAVLQPLGFTLGGLPMDMLETLVDLYLLHDYYKFLRHNPYDSLRDNEHYLRTTALLLSRGGITTA